MRQRYRRGNYLKFSKSKLFEVELEWVILKPCLWNHPSGKPLCLGGQNNRHWLGHLQQVRWSSFKRHTSLRLLIFSPNSILYQLKVTVKTALKYKMKLGWGHCLFLALLLDEFSVDLLLLNELLKMNDNLKLSKTEIQKVIWGSGIRSDFMKPNTFYIIQQSRISV